MPKPILPFLGIFAFLTVSAPAEIIFNLPNNTDISGVRLFGQTFVAPIEDDFLSIFTVRVHSDSPNTLFDIRVANWDNTNDVINGPILFASATQSAQPGGYTDFAVSPNLSLVAGGQYIAFIDNVEPNYFPTGHLTVGGDSNDDYSQGAFAFPSSEQIDSTWDVYANGQDLSFGATFVPEPLMFAAIGLSFLAATCRRPGRAN